MPKEELRGVVTRHGEKTGPSGRTFVWLHLNRGKNQGWVKVIGFYPSGIGPRCQGLEHIATGTYVSVLGKTKDDVFFAESVTRLSKRLDARNVPPAPPGPWRGQGIVVKFQPGKSKDWLEIITEEGDQVPASMKQGVLDASCLGKKFQLTGVASRSGFRHGNDAQACEET